MMGWDVQRVIEEWSAEQVSEMISARVRRIEEEEEGRSREEIAAALSEAFG